MPVRHFLTELLSGLFNFDAKLIHTTRDLFFPPGSVILEYNANRRVRYVPPLRLYLFTSVIFFILLAWSTTRMETDDPGIVTVTREGDTKETSPGLTLDLGGSEITDSTLMALASVPKVTNAMIDSVLVSAGTAPGFWTRAAVRIALNAGLNSQRKVDYVKGIFAAFSKLMFLLLPLFAVLLYLFHRGSGRFYTEHLVFALYFHTAAYLFIGTDMLVGSVFRAMGSGGLAIILSALFLIWSMRTVYRGAWWKTILKPLVILILYFVLLLVGFFTATVIGAFGV